jgi:hypothetical protein
MEPGTYKVCVKAADATAWAESGASVTTQDRVSSLSINGILEVLASIPMRKGTGLHQVLHVPSTGKVYGFSKNVNSFPFACILFFSDGCSWQLSTVTYKIEYSL